MNPQLSLILIAAVCTLLSRVDCLALRGHGVERSLKNTTPHAGLLGILSTRTVGKNLQVGLLEYTKHNAGMCYLMISVRTPSKPSNAKVDGSKIVCQASSFTPDPSFPGSFRCAVLSVRCPKNDVSVYGNDGKVIGKANFKGLL